MTLARRLLPLGLAALAAACAGSQPETRQPAPAPQQRGEGPGQPRQSASPGYGDPDNPWPVKTRYVVDLWLHGFALLTDDTSRVPLFRRGYRDEMVVEKNKRQITTLLDDAHDSLARYAAAHPYIANAQFAVLTYHNWDAMYADIQVFLASGGDPRKVKASDQAAIVKAWYQLFPGIADRKWLKLYADALNDESRKFYQAFWDRVELARRPVLAAADSAWSKVALKRFRRFQEGADLQYGDIYLSLPLGAEGRTLLEGKRQNVIAVIFPDSVAHAEEAVFVIAHEAVGGVAGRAVSDNTTPNEKKSGLADTYLTAATVRGGALIIERVLPAQATAYETFYLRAAGVPFAPGEEQVTFLRTWPLPDAIVAQMKQALQDATSGI